LGLGVGARGRRERREAQAVADMTRRVHALEDVAVPWLRARAETLGAPEETVAAATWQDPLDTTHALIETIVRLERDDLLPYNDTMELDALGAPPSTSTKTGLP
jgi:hypothetical protein